MYRHIHTHTYARTRSTQTSALTNQMHKLQQVLPGDFTVDSSHKLTTTSSNPFTPSLDFWAVWCPDQHSSPHFTTTTIRQPS